MDHNSVAGASFFATLLIFYCIIFVGFYAFAIWLFWRIFTKTGNNGTLALLLLIPGLGQLICMLILAFGRWPIEDQLAALQAGSSMPPPPSAPPGSSVMPTA